MSPDFVLSLFTYAFKTIVMVAGPLLLFGLVAGVLVSIIQQATSINEMTLTFIPKIIAVAIAAWLFMPMIIRQMLEFTYYIFTTAGRIGRG